MSKIFSTIVLTKGKSLNFNNEDKKRLIDLINSLKCYTNIVVILQGKFSKEEIEFYKNFNIKIIHYEKNLGFAGAHNIGIDYSLKNNADYVLILNHDIRIHKDFLNNMLLSISIDTNIGIVGPKIYDEKNRIWGIGGILDKRRYSGGLIDYGKEDKYNYEIIVEPDFVSGTAMLIKKEVFKKIGLFKEDYFIYYEDVDFSLRAKKAGFRIIVNPKAKITHYVSSSVGKDSPFKQYYMSRNHLMLVERFAPFSVKVHELIRLPKTFFETRLKKYELWGIKDYFLRRFGKNENWG